MLHEELKVREQGQPQGAHGVAVALIHAGHGSGLAQDGSHAVGEASQPVMWKFDFHKVPYICPPLPPGPPQCRATLPGLSPHEAALAISTLARRIPSNYTWPTSQAPTPKLFTQQMILAPTASPYHVFGTY